MKTVFYETYSDSVENILKSQLHFDFKKLPLEEKL